MSEDLTGLFFLFSDLVQEKNYLPIERIKPDVLPEPQRLDAVFIGLFCRTVLLSVRSNVRTRYHHHHHHHHRRQGPF